MWCYSILEVRNEKGLGQGWGAATPTLFVGDLISALVSESCLPSFSKAMLI